MLVRLTECTFRPSAGGVVPGIRRAWAKSPASGRPNECSSGSGGFQRCSSSTFRKSSRTRTASLSGLIGSRSGGPDPGGRPLPGGRPMHGRGFRDHLVSGTCLVRSTPFVPIRGGMMGPAPLLLPIQGASFRRGHAARHGTAPAVGGKMARPVGCRRTSPRPGSDAACPWAHLRRHAIWPGSASAHGDRRGQFGKAAAVARRTPAGAQHAMTALDVRTQRLVGLRQAPILTQAPPASGGTPLRKSRPGRSALPKSPSRGCARPLLRQPGSRHAPTTRRRR